MSRKYKITALRKAMGLTQKRLAELAETSRVTVSQLETDRRPNPSSALLSRIVRVLGVRMDYLLDDSRVFPPELSDIDQRFYKGLIRRPDGYVTNYVPEVKVKPREKTQVTSALGAGEAKLLPLLSMEVACGAAREAWDEVIDWVPVIPELYSSSRYYLSVDGDSMSCPSRDSIDEGDLLLVDRDLPPQEGDVIVAVIHREGEEFKTIKVYHRDDGRAVLWAQNPQYPPTVLEDNTSLECRGVVLQVTKPRRRLQTGLHS